MFPPRIVDIFFNGSCHHWNKLLNKSIVNHQKARLSSTKHPNKSSVSHQGAKSSTHTNLFRCHHATLSPRIISHKQSKLLNIRITMQQLCEKHTATANQSDKSFASVTNVGEADGWLNIGAYSVFAWSISGAESSIVVKSEDMQVAFDMGNAPKESIKVPNVFISHGHTDHIGSVVNHVFKRILLNMKPARYFLPPHLVEPLRTVIDTHYEMAELAENHRGGSQNLFPMSEGDVVKLNSRYYVKCFPTVHRVPSQGYIVYKETKTLKPEYVGMEGFEVAALHRDGVDIHDVVTTPEVAYTGDTRMEVFTNPPTPDLLQVKLLITEATFLDENDKGGPSCVEKARERGHIHLVEIAQNAHLFDDVGHIVLVHFSNKYAPKYICDCIRDKLPSHLRSRVTPATVAAATRPTTYL